MIRFLFVGDIMGKAGRRCLDKLLPIAKAKYNPQIIIANGENAAGGFGLTEKVFRQLTGEFGIDCITMGNHWHDKPEINDLLLKTDRIVLPANMMNVKNEEQGLRIYATANGISYAVINLIGKAFMHSENRSPFDAIDKLLPKIPEDVKIRIIDIHAEATSEKQGLAQYLAGRVSFVYGTHSHVPTADERIIAKRTGFVTDLGMTGSYDSVIGVRKDAAIHRLRTGEKKNFEPAEGDPWLCATIADIDEVTGYCKNIERIRWELANFEANPRGDIIRKDMIGDASYVTA